MHLRHILAMVLTIALSGSAFAQQSGSLRLPAIYSDGMIMQRNRPLTLRGFASPNSPVGLTIGVNKYRAKADADGNWAVTINPLYVGQPYTLTVTDGRDTLVVRDILAGEVWLASGQSNMEFTLGATSTAKRDVPMASDSLLRFYDMKPVAKTNNKPWTDDQMQQVNSLDYYHPTRWQGATPDAARRWSAIAYYFAQALRDSLDVPVGIICNAIGGSPTEAWVDPATLADKYPVLLLDWKSNEYAQDWVKQRMIENTGTDLDNRHPYEPTYLYQAGIEPLAKYPVKGVIWYQGESNAHDVAMHERLFSMLVQSWRQYFDDERMPFLFVQLSSLNRPKWPEFRDSQRRLSLDLSHVAMAVSSDVGDSLDVHPTNKFPVGQRLARAALRHAYDRDIVAAGPELEVMHAANGQLTLTFANSQGLTTSDGGAPITFEIAEANCIYQPADAIIVDNQVILSNKNMKQPIYARYGWQPYTRANLVNGAGLPASTFQAKADNTEDFEIEAGIEVGVSACAAGMLDGMLVMAGGCNFPIDPLGANSKKVTYQGIYTASPSQMEWQRIGSLPCPIAYSAFATVDGRLAIVGGSDGSQALSQALLVGKDGVEELPSLPVSIDNAAAAAVGSKLYVAGGNVNGTPSSALYMLDLDQATKGWRKLAAMPGNPRVQPAMAAAPNDKGEWCLWLFGGFAPRHAKHEPTLQTDGLCYNTITGRWSQVAAPVADGEEVGLGGGNGVRLADGRIVCTGGVNKDVFLEALRNQAPDYLMHSEEWYRFNPYLLVFDPATMQWTVAGKSSATARAGAASVASDNIIYIIGGEVKPRIRTSSIECVTL